MCPAGNGALNSNTPCMGQAHHERVLNSHPKGEKPVRPEQPAQRAALHTYFGRVEGFVILLLRLLVLLSDKLGRPHTLTY